MIIYMLRAWNRHLSPGCLSS